MRRLWQRDALGSQERARCTGGFVLCFELAKGSLWTSWQGKPTLLVRFHREHQNLQRCLPSQVGREGDTLGTGKHALTGGAIGLETAYFWRARARARVRARARPHASEPRAAGLRWHPSASAVPKPHPAAGAATLRSTTTGAATLRSTTTIHSRPGRPRPKCPQCPQAELAVLRWAPEAVALGLAVRSEDGRSTASVDIVA